MSEEKIPIGISSCLLGEELRFNGGHKRSRLCTDVLSSVFDFKGVCPEVAIGMGVPREAIRIVEKEGQDHVVGTRTADLDVTDELYAYGLEVGAASLDYSGFVLKKGSPSCGLYSAKVYRNDHPLPGAHQGVFVRALLKVNPLMPVEEEGRLNDAALRENFVSAVFLYHDWRKNIMPEPSPKKLVDFHSRYKFLVMSHGQAAYKELGAIVANAGAEGFSARMDEYIKVLMAYLVGPPSRKGHVNTLYHILGYLGDVLDGPTRQDLNGVIESYRLGHTNLSVPAAMLNHYIKRYGGEYIREQVYLNPYSESLGLRNSI